MSYDYVELALVLKLNLKDVAWNIRGDNNLEILGSDSGSINLDHMIWNRFVLSNFDCHQNPSSLKLAVRRAHMQDMADMFGWKVGIIDWSGPVADKRSGLTGILLDGRGPNAWSLVRGITGWIMVCIEVWNLVCDYWTRPHNLVHLIGTLHGCITRVVYGPGSPGRDPCWRYCRQVSTVTFLRCFIAATLMGIK